MRISATAGMDLRRQKATSSLELRRTVLLLLLVLRMTSTQQAPLKHGEEGEFCVVMMTYIGPSILCTHNNNKQDHHGYGIWRNERID